MSSVQKRVIDVIASTLHIRPDEIRPDANLILDFGADSLASVELLLALEDEFGIDIPDEEAEELTTVRQTIDAIAFAAAVKDVALRPREARRRP